MSSHDGKGSNGHLLVSVAVPVVVAVIGLISVVAAALLGNSGNLTILPGSPIQTVTAPVPPPMTAISTLTAPQVTVTITANGTSDNAASSGFVADSSAEALQVSVEFSNGEEIEPNTWRGPVGGGGKVFLEQKIVTLTPAGTRPDKCFTETTLKQGNTLIYHSNRGTCNYTSTISQAPIPIGSYHYTVDVKTGDSPTDLTGTVVKDFTVA